LTDIEQIYYDYFNDVYLFVKALCHDDGLAEEITSETFFKAMKSLDSFKGSCDIRVWLCQIAKFSYYSYLKKNKKYLLKNHVEAESIEANVEDLVINRELSRVVEGHLSGLSEPYRKVVFLRIYGDLSFKEIARLYGKTENWACVTYHRAKSKLRKSMEEYL